MCPARLRIVTLLVASIAAAGARANGAFPDEFSVHFPQGSPHTILIGANFGLLVSNDDGATWRYSCEPYVTTGSSAPLSSFNVGYYQVTADGALLADSLNLTRSADVGCSWPDAGVPGVPPAIVSDIFADPTDGSLVYAITTTFNGTSIVVSHDGGATFGAPVYSTSNIVTAIESSKSAPMTAYATQINSTGQTAALLRTTDQGANWTTLDMSSISAHAQPSILAVDPDDSSVVYLRIYAGLTDSIAMTSDGGQSFQVLLSVAGTFNSFLRAGDGSLYAGMMDGTLYVRAPGQEFAKRTGPRFRCLGQRPGTTRIYACGDMALDGFSLGYSDDGAQTFHKTMSFTDLLGPLTCPAVQTACAAHWARIQMVLGISDAGPVEDDAGTEAPDAGEGEADSGTVQPPPSGSGSHCASAGAGSLPLFGLLLALGLRRRATRTSRARAAR
jgi:photosystem II stability/assembly factor-like uncharacterized protein